jgi:hypothetical protein
MVGAVIDARKPDRIEWARMGERWESTKTGEENKGEAALQGQTPPTATGTADEVSEA